MKKLVTILAIIFTMAMVVGCNNSNVSQSSLTSSISGSEIATPNSSENEKESDKNDSESNKDESDDSSKVVQPITGGGNFNADNSYNK